MKNQRNTASMIEANLRPLINPPWNVRVIVCPGDPIVADTTAGEPTMLAVIANQPDTQLTVTAYYDAKDPGIEATPEIVRRINEQYALYLQRLTPPFETPKGPTT